MFTRESVLQSEWYRRRLETAQGQAIARCNRVIRHIEATRANDVTGEISERLDLPARARRARQEHVRVSHPDYLDFLEA